MKIVCTTNDLFCSYQTSSIRFFFRTLPTGPSRIYSRLNIKVLDDTLLGQDPLFENRYVNACSITLFLKREIEKTPFSCSSGRFSYRPHFPTCNRTNWTQRSQESRQGRDLTARNRCSPIFREERSRAETQGGWYKGKKRRNLMITRHGDEKSRRRWKKNSREYRKGVVIARVKWCVRKSFR